MARLLVAAMEQGGHHVELANRLRSRDAEGDEARQTRLARIGRARAERLLRLYNSRPSAGRPDIWFTYHVYYKAPDWIGPRVAEGLEIPYVVAEASVAHKRADGPWDSGHRATLEALRHASRVIALNPLDVECLPDRSRVRLIRPFIDLERYRTAATQRARHRNRIAARFGLDPEEPWIATVAMMRAGDKLASYRLLAEAMASLEDLRWRLIIVGDGPARAEVEAAFARVTADRGGPRVRFAGEVAEDEVTEHVAACDLMAWPAVNEAYGMAMLEAQAAGVPVVAGRSGGVPAVIYDGETGLLSENENPAAFAVALRCLLTDDARRRRLAAAAAEKAASDHALEVAAVRLDQILAEARAAGPVTDLPDEAEEEAKGASPALS